MSISPLEHLAGRAVDADRVGVLERLAVHGDLAFFLVDVNVASPGDAALAPAAGDDRRVAGHPAGAGQDARRGVHPVDVLRAGLLADQQHLFPGVRPLDGFLSRERQRPDRRPRRRGQPGGQRLGRLLGLGVEAGQQQLRQVVRRDPLHRRLLGDQLFLHHVACDFDGRGPGPLARPRLQHIQLAPLNRELDVLHILVVRFELVLDRDQLGVHLLVPFFHLDHGLGRADARDHVLALSVDEELAVKLVLARGGVAGKGDARAAVVAHVPERHRLHVDRRALKPGDLVDLPIPNCPRRVPRTEDRLDRQLQLLERILGERSPGRLLYNLLIRLTKFDKSLGIDIGIELDASLLLDLVELVFEIVVLDAHHDVPIHVDQPAVCVVGEPLVARLLREARDGLIIQAEVQHGVHHARHRLGRTGADADEQGRLAAAELLARLLLQPLDRIIHLGHQPLGELAAFFVVAGAGFGRDGEPGRHGQADGDHLREVCALPAEQLLHRRIAVELRLAEVVNHLSRLRRRGVLAGLFAGFLAGLLSVGLSHRVAIPRGSGAFERGARETCTRESRNLTALTRPVNAGEVKPPMHAAEHR